nr:MAG TPA: hypothetical protein [Caudoviricetes sp.]
MPLAFFTPIGKTIRYYYDTRFRPPCGALMRPLPRSGVQQRESGAFFFIAPPSFIYCFI